MKLATHVSTALLASTYFIAGIDNPVHLSMLMATIYVSQVSLDVFGHKWVTIRGRRFPARNRLHSLPGVVAWGLLFGSPFLICCPKLALAVIIGLLIHYAEDAITEGGVYLWGRKRRLPVRISYDNPVANRAAILAFMVAAAPVYASTPTLGAWGSLYVLATLGYAVLSFLYV